MVQYLGRLIGAKSPKATTDYDPTYMMEVVNVLSETVLNT